MILILIGVAFVLGIIVGGCALGWKIIRDIINYL